MARRSCNNFAEDYHQHIFVPVALQSLRELVRFSGPLFAHELRLQYVTADGSAEVFKSVWCCDSSSLRLTLERLRPFAMHLGAIRAPPREGEKLGKVVSQPFVLDLDRPKRLLPGCACVDRLCAVCWPAMANSALVVRQAARSLFEADVRMLFSGRRGVQVHVLSEALAHADEESRAAATKLFVAALREATEPTYPLDCGPSEQLGHVVRVPFSVHPETGNFSVPLDPDHIRAFDPSRAPNVRDVMSASAPDAEARRLFFGVQAGGATR